MPFDGTDFRAPPALDTGIFPLWSKHGFRLWLKARFRQEERWTDPVYVDLYHLSEAGNAAVAEAMLPHVARAAAARRA